MIGEQGTVDAGGWWAMAAEWRLASAGLLRLLLAGGLALGCERGASQESRPPESMTAETAAPVPPAPLRDTVLEAAIRSVAEGLPGAVGVSVRHLRRDVVASVNGDRRFALASVIKLPVAYAALQRADLDAADSVQVNATDRAPGETPFAAGRTTTVAQLVERSLAHSDNTASDVLLRLAGGPAEVNRRMVALGVGGVHVDRSMKQVFAGWRGIRDTDGIETWTLAEFDRRAAAVSVRVRDEAQAAFAADLRDAGSADGVLELLAALHQGAGLAPERRQLVLDALARSATGPNRIRAGVPAGTPVADKTGTLGPLTHDVGYITLPDGEGDVALVVLVESDAPLASRERVIAEITRAVWQRFATDPPAVVPAGP